MGWSRSIGVQNGLLSIMPCLPLISSWFRFQGACVSVREELGKNGPFYCNVKRVRKSNWEGRKERCLLCLRVFRSHFAGPIVHKLTIALICAPGPGSSFLSFTVQSAPVRSTLSPCFTSTPQQSPPKKRVAEKQKSPCQNPILCTLFSYSDPLKKV